MYFSSLLICKVGTSLPQLLHVNAKLKNSKKDTVIVFNLLLSNGMIIKEEIDYVYIYSVWGRIYGSII